MQLIIRASLIQVVIIAIFGSLCLQNLTDYNSCCSNSTYLEKCEKSENAEKNKIKNEKEILEDDWYHSTLSFHIAFSFLLHIHSDFKSQYHSPFLSYVALPPEVFFRA